MIQSNFFVYFEKITNGMNKIIDLTNANKIAYQTDKSKNVVIPHSKISGKQIKAKIVRGKFLIFIISQSICKRPEKLKRKNICEIN